MDAFYDLQHRKRHRYCPACGYAAVVEQCVRRCPGCGRLWPKRTKEYDEVAKRKVEENGSR